MLMKKTNPFLLTNLSVSTSTLDSGVLSLFNNDGAMIN